MHENEGMCKNYMEYIFWDNLDLTNIIIYNIEHIIIYQGPLCQ